MKSPFARHRLAFSLVEVVLALALVSFCLLSSIGLLPIGLKSIRNAHEEAIAANALNQLADALRNATVAADGHWVASGSAGAFSDMTWTTGAKPFTKNLDSSGKPTNSTSDARLVAHIELIPASADGITPGSALISIAWPAAATWTNQAWAEAEGSVSCGMQFLPKQ